MKPLYVAAMTLLVTSPFSCLAKNQELDCSPKAGSHGHVTAINERLELTLADGRVLRLAGLEAPGPTPNDPDLDSRAREWLTRWLLNQDITFALPEARPDRWGRYAAVAFAPALSGDAGQVSVAEQVIGAGFSRTIPDQNKISCEERLLQLEKAAREAKLGLWNDPYYAIVSATDTTAFAEHAGSFILAEGKLSDVRDISTRRELFFGTHRRNTLSVTILQRNVKIFEAAGLHFRDLIGQTLRVRGLLETRFGPEIELARPSDVEVVTKNLGDTENPVRDAPATKQP